MMAVLSSIAVWQVGRNSDDSINQVNHRVTVLCRQFTRLKRVEIVTGQNNSTGTALVRLLNTIDCKR
jgi:hypothetical protein